MSRPLSSSHSQDGHSNHNMPHFSEPPNVLIVDNGCVSGPPSTSDTPDTMSFSTSSHASHSSNDFFGVGMNIAQTVSGSMGTTCTGSCVNTDTNPKHSGVGGQASAAAAGFPHNRPPHRTGLTNCLLSFRCLLLVVIVTALAVNAIALASTNYGFSSSSLGHLQEMADTTVRKFVVNGFTEWLHLSENFIFQIGQFVRMKDALAQVAGGSGGSLDWENEDFIRNDVFPVLIGLAQAIKMSHPSYALSGGFGSLSGSVVSSLYFGQGGPLNFAYSNGSDWNLTAPLGSAQWPPLLKWPYAGGSTSDTDPWVLEPKTEVIVLAPHYNINNFPWYRDSLTDTIHDNETIQWRETVTALGQYTMTASLRIYTDSGDRLLGVANTWNFGGSCALLQQHFPTHEGIVFLIRPNSGKLFSTNTEATDVLWTDENGRQSPYLGSDSPNPIIAFASTVVMDRVEKGLDLPVSETLTVGRTRIILGALSFTAADRDLVVVTAAFYSRVYWRIDLGVGLSVGLSVMILILSIAIAVLLVSCIVRPLHQLIGEMGKIDDMDLDSIVWNNCLILSEMIALQSAFAITVRKLIEYRAYLPVSILEKGDVEQVGDSSTDECFSFSDDSHSMSVTTFSSSSRKSSSGPKGSMTEVLTTRFGLSLQTTRRIVLMLRIYGIDNNPSSMELLLEYIESVFEIIRSLSRLHGGQLLEYGMDNFVLVFAGPFAAIVFALKLQRRLTISTVTSAMFPFVIVVDSGEVVLGNVGCQRMRKTAVCGKPILRLRKIVEKLPAIESGGRICCTEAIHRVSSSETIRFPSDLVWIGSECAILYSVVFMIPIKPDEWMYELRDDELRLFFSRMDDCVRLLLHGNPKKAKEAFMEFAVLVEELKASGDELCRQLRLDEALCACELFGNYSEFVLREQCDLESAVWSVKKAGRMNL